MPTVIITSSKFVHEEGLYKQWEFTGTYDGQQFVVATYDGQYDYDFGDQEPPEDDEPIQIAVGEYAEVNNIDLGKCHR